MTTARVVSREFLINSEQGRNWVWRFLPTDSRVASNFCPLVLKSQL